MAGNSIGTVFTVTTFGESHGEALGVVIDGCPSNKKISVQKIQKELSRRRPGAAPAIGTARREGDKVEILSGLFEGKTDSFILQGCYFFLKNLLRKMHKGVDCHVLSIDIPRSESGCSWADLLVVKGSQHTKRGIDAHLLVGELFRHLNGRERNVFTMRTEGFTMREIGQVLGVSHVMVVKVEKKIKDISKNINLLKSLLK